MARKTVEKINEIEETKTVKKNKPTTKKTKTTSTTTVSKKTTSKPTKEACSSRKNTTTTTTRKKKEFIDIPEYYDLPYKYNNTNIKILAQNPTTLFVYWEISDSEQINLKKQFGDDFFYKTQPILIIHNLTHNYSFQVDINDFANNWYVHVDDAKCDYIVQLARREKNTNPINISFSNKIEMPNNHILSYHNHDKIYFKNIKTNKITEKEINLNDYYNRIFKHIYKDYKINVDDINNLNFDIKFNPNSSYFFTEN